MTRGIHFCASEAEQREARRRHRRCCSRQRFDLDRNEGNALEVRGSLRNSRRERCSTAQRDTHLMESATFDRLRAKHRQGEEKSNQRTEEFQHCQRRLNEWMKTKQQRGARLI